MDNDNVKWSIDGCMSIGLRMEATQVERSPKWFRIQTPFGAREWPFSGPWLTLGPKPLPPWRNACTGTAVLT